jgi:hypothetical protein
MPESARDAHSWFHNRGPNYCALVDSTTTGEPKPRSALRSLAEYLGFVEPPPKPPMCAYPYNQCMLVERKVSDFDELALSVEGAVQAVDLVCSSIGRWLERHDYGSESQTIV